MKQEIPGTDRQVQTATNDRTKEMVHNIHNNLSENIGVMFSGNMSLQKTATITSTICHSTLCIVYITYSYELHSTREVA